MKLTKTAWKIIKIRNEIYKNCGLLSPSEQAYLAEAFLDEIMRITGIREYFVQKEYNRRVAMHKKILDDAKKFGIKNVRSMKSFTNQLKKNYLLTKYETKQKRFCR